MDEYNKLFTSRQLVALTTFSDLIAEVREKATQDALRAGLPDANVELKNFLADRHWLLSQCYRRPPY